MPSFWRPQVMRHHTEGGGVEYAVHDVYFDDHGRPTSWTEHARSPRLPSVDKLREWIEQRLRVPAEGVSCGDLGYEHRHGDFALWRRHADDAPLDYDAR